MHICVICIYIRGCFFLYVSVIVYVIIQMKVTVFQVFCRYIGSSLLCTKGGQTDKRMRYQHYSDSDLQEVNRMMDINPCLTSDIKNLLADKLRTSEGSILGLWQRQKQKRMEKEQELQEG